MDLEGKDKKITIFFVNWNNFCNFAGKYKFNVNF